MSWIFSAIYYRFVGYPTPSAASPPLAKDDVELQTEADKISYCLGFAQGEGLQLQFKSINTVAIKKGFLDAFDKKNPAIPKDQITQIVEGIERQLAAQNQDEIRQLRTKNKEAGKVFLAANAEQQGVVCLTDGLQYTILEEGKGKSPTINDSVTIAFKVMGIDGTVFADMFENKVTITRPLTELMPAFIESLLQMKKGSKWKLFVPTHLSMGDSVNPSGKIEPGSTLIYELELISIR